MIHRVDHSVSVARTKVHRADHSVSVARTKVLTRLAEVVEEHAQNGQARSNAAFRWPKVHRADYSSLSGSYGVAEV